MALGAECEEVVSADDLILTDLSDSQDVRARLTSSPAPVVLPVAFNVTSNALTQAKKDFDRVVKAPTKSQAFLDVIDDALMDKPKAKSGAKTS